MTSLRQQTLHLNLSGWVFRQHDLSSPYSPSLKTLTILDPHGKAQKTFFGKSFLDDMSKLENLEFWTLQSGRLPNFNEGPAAKMLPKLRYLTWMPKREDPSINLFHPFRNPIFNPVGVKRSHWNPEMAKASIQHLQLFQPFLPDLHDIIPPKLKKLVLDTPLAAEADELESFSDLVSSKPELGVFVK